MIGGKGIDSFENKEKSGEGVIVYDSLRENNQVIGEFKNKMSNKNKPNSYDLLYYKYNQVIPFISLGYNLDDGVFFGGYMKIIQHRFRKTPYGNSHSITINRAISYEGIFNFQIQCQSLSRPLDIKQISCSRRISKAPHISNFWIWSQLGF